ncbi:ABC transporter ATP-binding protein [Ruicaihuangia caeni]|uniref:ABC transporter ATP-binding protein n=1 Tax=Ruicaihuangia caeni TaxID=3042517 RepID=UPI00338F403A
MTRKPAHELSAEGLTLAYEGRPVISELTLTIEPGAVTVIVGANGSGKSTLLRGLARLLKPVAGEVRLDGRQLRREPGRRLARVLGILPQSPVAPEGVTVRDLVARGRHPHQRFMQTWSSADAAAVAAALRSTGLEPLAHRRVDELSGGQRQRAWIAMALAQDPDILLLDEPTTFLDVMHQLEVLDLLHEANRTRGTTVVMVLHDLNLAARYADRLVVMAGGGVLAEGAPRDVISTELVREAFGLDARIVDDPVCGAPMVVPISRTHGAVA